MQPNTTQFSDKNQEQSKPSLRGFADNNIKTLDSKDTLDTLDSLGSLGSLDFNNSTNVNWPCDLQINFLVKKKVFSEKVKWGYRDMFFRLGRGYGWKFVYKGLESPDPANFFYSARQIYLKAKSDTGRRDPGLDRWVEQMKEWLDGTR